MATIETGWLETKAGNRFAPKTLSSQVYTSDNQTLESKVKAEHDELAAGVSRVEQQVANLIVNYTEYNLTLSASAWQGTKAPYTIQVSLTPCKTNSDLQILPSFDMTEDQVSAWMDAKVVSGKTYNSYFILKAYGDKPKINLPISALIGSTVL